MKRWRVAWIRSHFWVMSWLEYNVFLFVLLAIHFDPPAKSRGRIQRRVLGVSHNRGPKFPTQYMWPYWLHNRSTPLNGFNYWVSPHTKLGKVCIQKANPTVFLISIEASSDSVRCQVVNIEKGENEANSIIWQPRASFSCRSLSLSSAGLDTFIFLSSEKIAKRFCQC